MSRTPLTRRLCNLSTDSASQVSFFLNTRGSRGSVASRNSHLPCPVVCHPPSCPTTWSGPNAAASALPPPLPRRALPKLEVVQPLDLYRAASGSFGSSSSRNSICSSKHAESRWSTQLTAQHICEPLEMCLHPFLAALESEQSREGRPPPTSRVSPLEAPAGQIGLLVSVAHSSFFGCCRQGPWPLCLLLVPLRPYGYSTARVPVSSVRAHPRRL